MENGHKARVNLTNTQLNKIAAKKKKKKKTQTSNIKIN